MGLMADETPDALYTPSLADAYDSDPKGIYGRSYDALLNLLPQDLVVNSCVDVGVGTGNVLARVVARYTPAVCFGVDPSSSMLAHAQRKVPHMVAVTGDHMQLRSDARLQGIDLVMANFIIAYTGPAPLFASLHQAVGDDGTVAITTTTLRSFAELFAIAHKPIFRLFGAYYGLDPDNISSQLPPTPKDPDDLYQHLHNANFDVVGTVVTQHSLTFKNGLELFEFGFLGGWWVDLFDRIGVTRKHVPYGNVALRICQLLGLVDWQCRTSMETVSVLARKRR
jgi:hypothetical protein